MLNSDFVKSSRLFLYTGFGLVSLALFVFPAKVRVVSGVDMDIIFMGPIFALLVGVWSFPSLILGVIEASTSKKAVLLGFMFTLALTNIVLASIVWQYVRFPFTDVVPFLIPCIIADAVGLCYFAKGKKVLNVLGNPVARILLAIALASFPIFIVVGNFLQGTLFY